MVEETSVVITAMNKILIALGILILVALGGFFIFAPKSVVIDPVRIEGWKDGVDAATKSTFQYPESLSEEYIQVNDWPPEVQKKAGTLICKEGEVGEGPVEKTERRTINGREYCVIATEEGAAGSEYGQYLYRGRRDDGIVTVLFTLRYDQCAKFDAEQKAACEAERASFDLDQLVDQIVMSVGDEA